MSEAMAEILPLVALVQENPIEDVETTAPPHDHVETPSNSKVVGVTPPVSRKSLPLKRTPFRLLGTTIHTPDKNQTLSLSQETDDVIVYDAMPLQWVRAHHCSLATHKTTKQMCGDAINTMLRLSSFPVSRKSPRTPTLPFRLFGTTIHIPDQNQTLSLSQETDKKKKRKQMCGDAINPRIKRTRVVVVVVGGGGENQQPSVPIEQIPGLTQAVASRGGREAVFLYRKKLEYSDVEKWQNRLFVTKKERVMKFLKEEEVQVVEGQGRGLKMTAFDGGGQLYRNMGFTKWISLNMLVINSDWRKLMVRNNARKGDVVEIWGFRDEAHKPCFAFNFIHAPPL